MSLQSSQELYTVSVESVPQYAGGNGKRPGCCKSGRVGKDLLCGVLIALAVICAAVAIFLVVFYVVNGMQNTISFHLVIDLNSTFSRDGRSKSGAAELSIRWRPAKWHTRLFTSDTG
jgi:hypothetical protein